MRKGYILCWTVMILSLLTACGKQKAEPIVVEETVKQNMNEEMETETSIEMVSVDLVEEKVDIEQSEVIESKTVEVVEESITEAESDIKEEVASEIESVVEETETTTIEETEVPMESSTEEATEVEAIVETTPIIVETTPVVEEVVVDARITNAYEKIERLKMAYFDLLAANNKFSNDIQHCAEHLVYCFEGRGMTADGKTMKNAGTAWSIASYYYYQYVNENGSYIDLEKWMLTQPSSDYIINTYLSGANDNSSTNDMKMIEAIGVVKYLTTLNDYSFGPLVETTAYNISNVPSAYALSIFNAGVDTGMIAVFDANNNLLNICTVDGFDNYLTTWALNPL